jgi:prephenate dehydrogenase
MNPVIGIIGGNGRMGWLFADFFKQKGLKVLISDIGTKLTNKKLVQGSDIVIVSVPIDKTIRVIKEVLPYIKSTSAIMDLTSIKEAPVAAMLKGKCEVMGMHPMFGNGNPISGQTIILCPTKKSKKWSKWMVDFLQGNHILIEKMTPSEHDKIMNIAQGLIHFAEITFADALRRCKLPIRQLLQYTGKASELKIQLAARIIAQDSNLYGSIQIENPHALKSLNEYKKSIDKLIKIVKNKDSKAFKRYFNKNKKYFGKYRDEAFRDSSILIDKLLELQNKKP